MRRPISTIVVIMTMLIAACGGSGDEGEPDASEVATTQADLSDATAGEQEPTPDTTAPAANDGEDGDTTSGAESHFATATIDGETYIFGDTGFAAQRCSPSTFGMFFVVLYMVDDQGNPDIEGGVLNVVLPHDDTDPEELDQWPELTVSIADPDREWIADEKAAEEFDIDPGVSQVDSYTIDGNRVSGTASFYESDSYWAMLGGQADELEVAQGTFEVICADS